MAAFDFPNSHMFVATSDKLRVVIGVKLYVKYWKYTGIPKA